MNNMKYVRIEHNVDNMEFIINRFDNSKTSSLTVIEVGHSHPPVGKKVNLVSSCYQLHYVTCGKGAFMDEEISEGRGYLVLPGETYRMQVDSCDFEQYWINFDGSDAKKLLYHCGFILQPHVFDFGKKTRVKTLVVELLKSIFPATQNADIIPVIHSHTYLMGTLYQLLSANETDNPMNLAPSDRYTTAVCSYIRAHYPEKLTVEWLAAVVGLSPKYLIRIFKKETGMTLMEYLTRARLDAACNLLENTTKSICEISEAVGYSDALYFSKVFRNTYGISPRTYRQGRP